MYNTITLIGRLTQDPETNEENYTYINLAVQRSYRNEDGIFETDFFKCLICNNVALSKLEYCQKGDLIVISGRLENLVLEDVHGKIRRDNIIKVDRLNYLCCAKFKLEEEENQNE
jgi:single-strand DNA-binding protein